MKMSVVVLIVLLFLSPSCVKSIAGEEKTIDYGALHRQRFGASAHDLLSADHYTALKIEVQYMPGFEPDREAIYNLYIFLKERLHKPGGITIVTKKILPDSSALLTTHDVKTIESKNRTAVTVGNQLALYILYTNGEYINDKVFGLSYFNTSAVIFGKSIRQYSGKIGQPNRTKLETTVLLHEMGHLLGLMGQGTSMQEAHFDETHSSHCNNRKCLMYYSIGTKDKFGYLIKGDIPDLDEQCLADLRANGGK